MAYKGYETGGLRKSYGYYTLLVRLLRAAGRNKRTNNKSMFYL